MEDSEVEESETEESDHLEEFHSMVEITPIFRPTTITGHKEGGTEQALVTGHVPLFMRYSYGVLEDPRNGLRLPAGMLKAD